MKTLIVLNPASGKNAEEPILQAVSRLFPASQMDYEVYKTVKGEKAGDIVRSRLTEGFDMVVAAGGDGTVSDVMNGLVGSSVPLGIIPAGTGNLIARELNIPLEIEVAAALIAGAHKLRKIDAMKIGQRVFLLNISIGISASVVSGTTPQRKSRFGRLAYVMTAILKIFTYRRRRVTVTIDGKTHTHGAVEVTIANCGILSKMLYPKGPDVSIDDGHLDIWILSAKTLQDYPRYLFQMINRRPAKDLSHFINAEKKVSIRSKIPLPVQADGDMVGTTPVEVEVMAGAFSVVVAEKPGLAQDSNLDIDKVLSQYLAGFAPYYRKRKV